MRGGERWLCFGVPRRTPWAQRPKPRGPGAPFTCVAWGSRRQRRNPAAGRQALSRPVAVDKARKAGKLVHRGPRGASLKHRARDAGEPGTSWWLPLCTPVTLCVHRLRGALGFPAFRAPSDFRGETVAKLGRTKRAARIISHARMISHVWGALRISGVPLGIHARAAYSATLPWRGRVGEHQRR